MRARTRVVLPLLGGLLAVYLLAPIVAFTVRLRDGAAGAPGLWPALLTSLGTATISAAVVTVLGTPLAYLLARRQGTISRLLLALVALPLALPPLTSGLLLLGLVGPLTAVGELFGGRLTDTRAGIVLAQTFVAAPFLVIAARAAFLGVDPALEDVAATLGHGRLGRFARVAAPAALPGIVAGIMLTWLRAFGEFGATVILAYHPSSLPVLTFAQFDETGLPGTIAPTVAALAAAIAVLLAIQLPLRTRRRRGSALAAAPSASPHPPAAVSPHPLAAPHPPPAAPQSPASLDFAVAKRLGSFSLRVAHRAHSPRLALLGASGAGKTLTLRLLAGLVRGEGGGHLHAGPEALHLLAAERRRIGYVPQQSALMPRRTVWRQVTFGVDAQPALASWWIERLGLAGLEDRLPHELSGGQQRRVALARALAAQPRLLLLDEPFTGLDAPVRDRLRREMRRLQREAGVGTVIVTHDPEEAAMLADEVIVLSEGRVLQAGPREQVFGAPCSAQVAGLLGIGNVHRGVVLCGDRLLSEGVEIRAALEGATVGAEVAWCVRPERIEVRPDGDYEATLLDEVDLGAARELTISLGGSLELTVRPSARGSLTVGEPLRVEIAATDVAVWGSPAPDGEAVAPAALAAT